LTRFTILGRVARNHAVWFTAGRSPFQSIDQLLSEARRRSIVFGVPEVGSTNFVAIAITSFLLGINTEFIAGFSGSRETSLAVLRGDVDIGSFNFESVLDRTEAGDLRPLLQISSEQISGHSSLQDAPLLGGNAGVAARQALKLRRDVERATADAGAVAELAGAGRVIAAPLGLEEGLARCLEQRLHEALTNPAFEAAAAAASRSLNVARADEARADLQAAAEKAERFIPIVRETIRNLRG
jgi:tripartite-type tricarboxylate transporter receptor subunit TctC